MRNRRERREEERKARKLLKRAPERAQGETVEGYRRRVLAYMEECALSRFARNLPPEPRPTPKASALIASVGATALQIRNRYLQVWMQEGSERLVIYRIGEEELRVGRRYGETRVDMWVFGELGDDEPDPQLSSRTEGRSR